MQVTQEKTAAKLTTKDWYAWINTMPPPPDEFHVVGCIEVANPGITVKLTPSIPQGTNPTILLLDLYLIQQPGMWPQQITWTQARYDEVLTPKHKGYSHVQIFYQHEKIAEMDVQIVK